MIINDVEAKSNVSDRVQELLVGTARDVGGVLVEVRNSGLGLTPNGVDCLFAFYRTKSSAAEGDCPSAIRSSKLTGERSRPRRMSTEVDTRCPAVPYLVHHRHERCEDVGDRREQTQPWGVAIGAKPWGPTPRVPECAAPARYRPLCRSRTEPYCRSECPDASRSSCDAGGAA